MNEQHKIKGIVEIFNKIADEIGIMEDETECKCRVGRIMDNLFGPCWRHEVNLHTHLGADPFGGGWMPEIDLMHSPTPMELDRMYKALQRFARDREMPRDNLEHMPEEMDHEAYEEAKPKVSKVVKVVISKP